MLRPLLALSLAVAFAAAADGAELRPAKALPEASRARLAEATTRAFDHVHAARVALSEERAYDARKELAHASLLLAQARAASPATRVQDQIAAIRLRLDDPTRHLAAWEFEPIFSTIDAAGDEAAFSATRRYVERARFFRLDADAATRELAAAVARLPFGEADGPVAAAQARVDVAMIELQVGNLEAARGILDHAAASARQAVRIAGGTIDPSLPAVAAPPPAPATKAREAAPEPATTESEISEPGDFLEY